MIPSVQERKKNVHVFMNFYPYLCRLQNTIPNPNIKVDNSNKSLDFVGDRLKFDDWKPVLEAISNDRTLHFISVRSRYLNAKGKFSSVQYHMIVSTLKSLIYLLFIGQLFRRLPIQRKCYPSTSNVAVPLCWLSALHCHRIRRCQTAV